MLITGVKLYIPISEKMLGRVLDESLPFEDAIDGFGVAQIAALIVLQYLPKIRINHSPSPDLILIEVTKSGTAQVARMGLSAFTADALRVLDRGKIREGYGLLSEFSMALLDDEAVKERRYLTVDGYWDSGFRDRHTGWLIEPLQRIELPAGGRSVLTDDQSRVFREVKSQANDHLHVQGYAGTGKSYLIKSLLTTLQATGGRVLVLAERQRQLDALLADIGRMDRICPRRFDELVSEMIPPDLTSPMNRRMARTNHSPVPISDDQVVRHLGIQPSGRFSPRNIVKAVRSTMGAFCASDDREIETHHIPDWCAATFDDTTKQVVLHHATELWQAVLTPPSRDFQPPVRGYHQVKWAALNGWKIPVQYTHVLIDECHDLRKPMLQILDSSPQVVISLGDEYQNLQGRPQRRASSIRQRAVTHSVRSGRMLEQVVNPIITAHPGGTKYPFHGNPFHKTEIVYYTMAQVPDRPAVILVNDTWGMFEWAQRLAADNVDFELLSSRGDLNIFVTDCIELYQHGIRPRHGELFRFDSWNAVANSYHDNRGFQRIDRMLKKGYRREDWMKTSARFVRQLAHGCALGFIEDVRNREFDAVMLTPEVVDRAWRTQRRELAVVGSAIYVAVTRARRRLIVPEQLRNWIEDISAASTDPAGARAALARQISVPQPRSP